MSKFLIIGCGYIGNLLGSFLIEQEHKVFGIRRQPHQLATNISPIEGDWHDMQLSQVPDVDYIFYLMSPDNITEQHYEKTYHHGVLHLINLLKQKKQTSKIILASSTRVYDCKDGSWVDENAPVDRENPFSRAMLMGEEALIDSGFDFSIARIAGIYGPNRHHLLTKIINKDISYRKNCVFSNRIHQKDCARALIHLTQLTYNEGIYNLVDQEPSPLNTIISWVSGKTGTALEPTSTASNADLRLSNKQCSSQRLLHTGFIFDYPNYQAGFSEILRKEFNVY